MADPITPRKVQANGKDSWWLVSAVAVPDAPTVAEINATTGLNFSCALLASFEGLTGSTGKVTLDRYLCETETFEANDNTVFTMSDIVGGFDPQADDGSPDRAHFEFLEDGFVGWAVRRQAVVAKNSAGVVAGQRVDLVPVDIAPAIPGKSNTDASGIYTFTAGVAVTGSPALNKKVVA